MDEQPGIKGTIFKIEIKANYFNDVKDDPKEIELKIIDKWYDRFLQFLRIRNYIKFKELKN